MNAVKPMAVTLTMLLSCTAASNAACGKGKIPNYEDITTVAYERTNCFGHCPTYQVIISKLEVTYVGAAWVDMTGTYETPLGHTLPRARSILKAHNFYNLNYDDSPLVTDVPHYIVAALRCGVTTKIDWPDFGPRADILSLFDDLDSMVEHLKWHKTSDKDDFSADLDGYP
jgi:hypothetical protein